MRVDTLWDDEADIELWKCGGDGGTFLDLLLENIEGSLRTTPLWENLCDG